LWLTCESKCLDLIKVLYLTTEEHDEKLAIAWFWMLSINIKETVRCES
jgi:hypothetical protein